MEAIVVIGPIDGLYHLGYQSAISNTFYSMSEFVNPDLAHALADKMNHERARSIPDGIPAA